MAKHSPPARGPSLLRRHSSGNRCSRCHQCWCSPAWAPAPHTAFFCAHFNSVSRSLIYTFTSPRLNQNTFFSTSYQDLACKRKGDSFLLSLVTILFFFFFFLSELFIYFKRVLQVSAIKLIKQSPRAHLKALGLPNLPRHQDEAPLEQHQVSHRPTAGEPCLPQVCSPASAPGVPVGNTSILKRTASICSLLYTLGVTYSSWLNWIKLEHQL